MHLDTFSPLICSCDRPLQIPCHLVNGAWGVIAVGLFASPGRLLAAYGREKHVGWCYSWGRGSGDATLLGAQLVEILFIIGWTFAIMMPFFIWLDWMGWFRSDPLDEIVGLDTSYHGGVILGDSDAQPEYISAYKQRKAEKLANKGGGRGVESATEWMYEEDEMDKNEGPADIDDDNDEEAVSYEPSAVHVKRGKVSFGQQGSSTISEQEEEKRTSSEHNA